MILKIKELRHKYFFTDAVRNDCRSIVLSFVSGICSVFTGIATG